MRPIPTREELQALYARGVNIMAYLRELKGISGNDEEIIKTSYDLQAGSYVAALDDPAHAALTQRIGQRFAQILDDLRPATLLEAGTGELTTLAALRPHLRHVPERIAAFDISGERLRVGRAYWEQQQLGPVDLFAAALQHIPLPSTSIDVIFTSHAIEPNGGAEESILRELQRVARRYVVLREPSWELGDEVTRRRIEHHRYVKDLPAISRRLGFRVLQHVRWELDPNPGNQAALLVLAKT